MKTKFFKKLSLVLVVAMVLSLFVPAAGVFAASKPSLNSDNKYLHLSGNPGPNEYNFNIKNKKKGWSYQWESKDESIAVVNEKNGVTTAKAVGKTTVYVVITDKDGEEVDTLEAKVTVRDNIKEVSVKNPVEKLAVGEAHDYNRSFVTESGSTKKTDSITRWTVEPSETAEIDDKGVFVATAGGEYTITARSFQSKARHKSWKADPEKYADYVLASDTTKVVVSANIVEVKQINKTQFNVVFDSSMKDTDLSKDTAKVYQIINGKQYDTGTEKIKGLSLDESGKVATVEIFGNIVSKSEYQFVYGDLKDGFTAADNDIKEVAGLIFEDFQVKTDGTDPVDLRSKVNAVNKDGVVILNGNDNALSPYLIFSYDGDVNNGWIYDDKAFVTKNGYAAKFTVTYNNFLFNDVTKVFDTIKYEAFAMGLGVDVLLNNNTMQYAVVERFVTDEDPNSPPESWKADWKTGGFKVAAGDENFRIFARYKKNTDPSWASYTNAGTYQFNYVSTDTDKLVIRDNELYPITAGEVVVLVQDPENNNATIGAFEIVILASRGYATAIADNYNVSLGNADLGANSEMKKIKITSTDTMNDPIQADYVRYREDDMPELVSGPGRDAVEPVIEYKGAPARGEWDYGAMYFEVTAKDATPGTYTYRFTLRAFNTNKQVIVRVTVTDSSVAAVTNWKVELDNANINLKEQKGTLDVAVYVYGYNAKGARVDALNTSDFEIEVRKIGGGTIAVNQLDKTIPVVFETVDNSGNPVSTNFVTGTAVSFIDSASYVVTAKAVVAEGATSITGRADGVPINTITLTVDDKSELEVNPEKRAVSVASFGTVKAAAKEAFKVKLNGGDINWDHVMFEYTLGGVKSTGDGSEVVSAGQSFHITKIFFEKTYDDSTVITYTFNVNRSLTLDR